MRNQPCEHVSSDEDDNQLPIAAAAFELKAMVYIA